MNVKLKGVFYLFFLMKLIAVIWEIISVNLTLKHLKQGNTGFEPNSLMEKMAANTDIFFENQIKAHRLRLNNMFLEVKSLFLYLLVTVLTLSTTIRKGVLRISKEKLKILNPEMVLLVLFTSMIALTELYTKKLVLISNTYIMKQIAYPLNIIIFFIIEIPCVIYLVTKLLDVFGEKFVLTCYIAFFIDDLIGVSRERGPDMNKLTRISSEIFPERVQESLRSEGLDNSIYKSKNPKDRKNAALVGFGRSRRIEIYGDFDIENSKELHSIIMHEIGHSVDNTIVKRKLFKYAVIICEVAVLTWIYIKGSKKFGCSDISTEGFFIMTFITYLISGRPWVFMILNIYTQRSELFADEFARNSGYGKQLSYALFKITLEHDASMDPSFLFHAIGSLHPGTRSRIETCSHQSPHRWRII